MAPITDKPIRRADLLRKGLAALLGKLIDGLEEVEERFVQKRFRPPGALPETEFVSTCQRCNACVEACIPGVLHVSPPEAGLSAGTPFLEPATGPCQLCPSLPCISACPSGALRPLPLTAVRIGLAELDPDRCVTWQGQSCQVCLDVCPLPEKAIAMEEGHPRVLEDRCTGCGICGFACVSRPTALAVRHL